MAKQYNIGIIEETTFGTVPGSALQLLNVSDNFAFSRNRSTGRPNVLRATRMKSPEYVLSDAGGVLVPSVMQYKNNLLLYEGAQGNDIGSAISETGTDVDVNGSTGVITSTADMTMTNFAVGQMVKMSGWTDTTLNVWVGPISATSATTITVPAGQVATEAAGNSITIKTQALVNGLLEKTYALEQHNAGLTTNFITNVGNAVASASWTWQQDQFMQEQFGLVGKALDGNNTATVGTGSATAALTTGEMGPVAEWGSMFIDEASTAYIISSLSLNVANDIGGPRGLGSSGPSAASYADQDVTVDMTLLHDDNSHALLAKIDDMANQTVALRWDMSDAEGNGICFHVPALKAKGGVPTPSGNLPEFPVSLSAHDPARDANSAYTSSAFGYQLGIYFAAA